MNRQECLIARNACLKLAWQAPDDDTRETYVRIAHTWLHQATLFVDPDREAKEDNE